MQPILKDLTPHLLWKHFEMLTKIPRCSGSEEAVLHYIRSSAESLELDVLQDSVGNMVVKKPATRGLESSPTVALQSHVDMVCEKNSDFAFDFAKNPIQLRRNGEYITAEGTTLGADNGTGVAAALAVLEDPTLEHGPLEALFTIDEESGLTGAQALSIDLLSSRIMINLDTEEEKAIYIGCAGGGESEILLPLEQESNKKETLRIFLSGLKGGHSGVDIHLERGNAIKILGRILYEAGKTCPFFLRSCKGGDKHNAIPREAEALVALHDGNKSRFEKSVEKAFTAIQKEYRKVEPQLSLLISKAPSSENSFSHDSTRQLVQLIHALPHGICRWSPELPHLVETSCNLAKINTADKALIVVSSRSSSMDELEALRDQIEAIAALAGAECSRDTPYPGWDPDPSSKLLKIFLETGEEIWGEKPLTKAIHAGLETGIIGEKFSGMDMISIGPQIEFPHSPDERVKIASVETFYTFLTKGLKKTAMEYI